MKLNFQLGRNCRSQSERDLHKDTEAEGVAVETEAIQVVVVWDMEDRVVDQEAVKEQRTVSVDLEVESVDADVKIREKRKILTRIQTK